MSNQNKRKKKRQSHGFEWRTRYVDDERSEQVVEVNVQINRLTAHAYGLNLPRQRLFDFAEEVGQEEWIAVGHIWEGLKPCQTHPSYRSSQSFEVDRRFVEDGLPRRGTQRTIVAAIDEIVVAAKPVLLRLRCTPDQEHEIPRLLAQLRDKNPSTILCVTQSIAEGGDTVILALIDALKDDPPEEHVRVLREFRKYASFAIPELTKQVASTRTSSMRCRAARVLGVLGREAKDAVPALIATFDGARDMAQDAMSDALASIAADAVEVVPALIHSLGHGSSDIQLGVSLALGRIANASDEVVHALLAAARADNPTLRAHAASGLGQVKPALPEVIATLVEVLRDENSGARSAAADSLKNINTNAKEAVPALIVAARDADGIFVREAIEALGNFGADAKDAVNLLIEALDDKEVNIQIQAAETLKRVGPGTKQAEQAIIEALDHENSWVRSCIVDLLRSLDADVPGLEDICELGLIDA